MARIFVTGAGGMLGGCVTRALQAVGMVTGCYHTRPVAGAVPLELTDPDAVEQAFTNANVTHIVHCAAIRDPNQCLADPLGAYQANTLAVEYVAKAAAAVGAHLVHISTDYVFDGENPPAREDDLPRPVNIYGRTKLAGEHAARACPQHTIVRIPALYRVDLSDARSVTAMYAKRLRTGERWTEDCETVRYYTLADDIAQAVRFLIEGAHVGVFHVSAEQKTNKADFARRLAACLGVDTAAVADGPAAVSGDRRPRDSQISPAKYLALGGPPMRSLDEGLATLHA